MRCILENSDALIEALSWQLASAIVKRHPKECYLFIGHPGGGQYDVLWIKQRPRGEGQILLNRNGTIQIHGRFQGSGDADYGHKDWQEYILSDHKEFVRHIEEHARLPKVKVSPKMIERILCYQTFSHLMTHYCKENVRVTIRNGYYDSSGMTGSSKNDDVLKFKFSSKLLQKRDDDLFNQPYYRFWIFHLINDDTSWQPIFCIEEASSQIKFLDGTPAASLMEEYNLLNRNFSNFLDEMIPRLDLQIRKYTN